MYKSSDDWIKIFEIDGRSILRLRKPLTKSFG